MALGGVYEKANQNAHRAINILEYSSIYTVHTVHNVHLYKKSGLEGSGTLIHL
jgi:hypothetical protein